MNGNVSLVVNNAAFINHGTFYESKSTLKLTGHVDTTQSYISGGVTTFYNLTVNKSAYGSALKSHSNIRNILNVSAGKLYTDSNLTLLSDSELTARVGVVPSDCNIIGKVNVERFIPGRRSWRLLTAPVTNSNTFFNSWQNSGVYAPGKGMYITGPNPTGASGNGLDASPMNNYSLRGFNFYTQSFTNISNTKVPISAGVKGNSDNTGFFVFVRGDRVYSNFDYESGACNVTTLTSIGSLQTGTQIFPVSKDSAKYTLIGNPYASPIDLNNIVRNNVIKRFFLFDPSISKTGGWLMIDDIDGDGTFTKSIGASNMSKDIQSGQAFFVQTSGNYDSASIVFHETCKSGENNILAFRPSGNNKIETLRSVLFLLDADGKKTLADGVLTEYKEGYSSDVNLEDASKIANTNENIGLVRKGLVFTVERRPVISNSDTVFLKLWKTVQRKYQLEFEALGLNHPGLQGMLEDSYLKTTIPLNLSGTSTVEFTIDANPASSDVNRFRIVFRPAPVVLPVTIKSLKAALFKNGINVEWVIENEINIAKYEVEKSADGNDFTSEYTQISENTNNSDLIYSWLDKYPINGNNYYRIKVEDINGQISYSQIVKVFAGNPDRGIILYPNPIMGNTINLQFKDQQSGLYKLKLLNHLGQQINQFKIPIPEGSSNQSLKLSETMPAGIYYLEIVDPSNKFNKYTFTKKQ